MPCAIMRKAHPNAYSHYYYDRGYSVLAQRQLAESAIIAVCERSREEGKKEKKKQISLECQRNWIQKVTHAINESDAFRK